MAQWLGQFTGRTHSVAVDAASELLAAAVKVLGTTPAEQRAPQLKKVRNLAERVLRVRRRYLKAQVKQARDRSKSGLTPALAEEIGSLERRLAELEAGGALAILEELGVT